MTNSTRHAKIRTRVQFWMLIHISMCPVELAIRHKPNPKIGQMLGVCLLLFK